MAISREQIEFVFKKFLPNSKVLEIQEFVSGHINETYLIITPEKRNYVLQKINSFVFKKTKSLIENKVMLSDFLQSKTDTGEQLQFIRTSEGNPYFKDEKNGYWNMSVFIAGSKTYERVTTESLAYEGGRLIGEFLNATSDFDPTQLDEILPNFHQMSFRFDQFEESLQTAQKQRLKMAEEQIDFALKNKDEMHLLQQYQEEGKIQPRVTHNDTKISNALFDESGKGICLIDTDTVMLGIAHYDFGDAVRTFCNTADEDETDLEIVRFNMDYFRAMARGFLEKMHKQLSVFDIACLGLAGKTITFIMGLRMLTDFLNNDVYYKTNYDNHNLDRAKNQFKLVMEIESFMGEMNAYVEAEYNKLNQRNN